MIKHKLLFLFLFSITSYQLSHAQIVSTATYFSEGINSPWAIGLDYDLGFAKVLSFNIQLIGGASSQVNADANFGDVYFGEIRIAPRIYMNKVDTWKGLYLAIPFRVGYYDLPFRTSGTTLVLNRLSMPMIGLGIYIGYRWQRNLVTDMKGFPFTLVLEPYLGWSWDTFFAPTIPQVNTSNAGNINRFTVGLTFKIGFYTHKKSKATLKKEADALEQAKKDSEKTNSNTNETKQ